MNNQMEECPGEGVKQLERVLVMRSEANFKYVRAEMQKKQISYPLIVHMLHVNTKSMISGSQR